MYILVKIKQQLLWNKKSITDFHVKMQISNTVLPDYIFLLFPMFAHLSVPKVLILFLFSILPWRSISCC